MGLHCFPFINLELFMSLNVCLDIKWAYLVFLLYFFNYSCPLMHAWILNGLTILFLSYFWIYSCPLMHAQILNEAYLVFLSYILELFMSLNACSWMLNVLTLFSFHTFGIIHVL